MTEVDEEFIEPEDEEEAEYEDPDIAEALKIEMDSFLEVLESQGESAEMLWEPEEASKLEQACAALNEASEALQTVRDAKEALLRRAPQKGRPSGKKGGGK